MDKPILITSFATWLPHQTSNASDDLLELLLEKAPGRFQSLQRIPVDFEGAPRAVIDAFGRLGPGMVVCCGMAEGREKLSVESRAVSDGEILETDVDLDALVSGLPMTEISHDAGDFVCNALYYRMLDYLRTHAAGGRCVFVHVPVLTADNAGGLLDDFERLLIRLQLLAHP